MYVTYIKRMFKAVPFVAVKSAICSYNFVCITMYWYRIRLSRMSTSLTRRIPERSAVTTTTLTLRPQSKSKLPASPGFCCCYSSFVAENSRRTFAPFLRPSPPSGTEMMKKKRTWRSQKFPREDLSPIHHFEAENSIYSCASFSFSGSFSLGRFEGVFLRRL